jgi:hypothetical protein
MVRGPKCAAVLPKLNKSGTKIQMDFLDSIENEIGDKQEVVLSNM